MYNPCFYGCDSTLTKHPSVLAEVKILLFKSLNMVSDLSDYLQMWFRVHLFFIIHKKCTKT